ncbi:phosphoesterase family-domain-containing protein [Chytridium lagenaria]|nr:phosphoesterase family-domain-containing protein [Chytridium lagenaria]
MKVASILSVALSMIVMAIAPSDVLAGGGSKPVVVEGKIKTVVVLVMENRSFDHYLGYWARTRQGVNGMPVDACNTITATGKKICAQDTAIYINKDPNHETLNVTEQIYGAGVDTLKAAKINAVPTMSGFADVNSRAWETTDPSIVRQAMDGYNPRNVPVTAALASEFAVFDRWFCSVPGSTYPNRLFIYSATSNGRYENSIGDVILGFPQKSIFGAIEEKGLTWKNYHGQIPTSIFMKDARQVSDLTSKIKTMSTFYSDAKEGKLPNFSLIDPIMMSVPGFTPNDNHPPHNVARGELLVKNIYEALRQSPQWNETLFLITYDENGGFYDHVAPPSNVPIPDDASAASPIFRHDRLGSRVPTLAISPWIKKGRVVTKPNGPTPTSEFEHSSISATLKNIFKLDAFLTKRDAWAGTFDFLVDELSTPRTDAAWTLPDAPAVDQAFVALEENDADSVEEYEVLKEVMDKLLA